MRKEFESIWYSEGVKNVLEEKGATDEEIQLYKKWGEKRFKNIEQALLNELSPYIIQYMSGFIALRYILQEHISKDSNGIKIKLTADNLADKMKEFLENTDKVKMNKIIGDFVENGLKSLTHGIFVTFFTNNPSSAMSIGSLKNWKAFIGPLFEFEYYSTENMKNRARIFIDEIKHKKAKSLDYIHLFIIDMIDSNPRTVASTAQEFNKFLEVISNEKGRKLMESFYETINNGYVPKDYLTLRRMYDLGIAIIGRVIHSSPLKQSRNVKSKSFTNNLPLDGISVLQFNFITEFVYNYIGEEPPNLNILHLDSAMTSEGSVTARTKAARKMLSTLLKVQTPGDVKHNQKIKMSERGVFNTKVIESINKKIRNKHDGTKQALLDYVVEYYRNPDNYEKIDKELYTIAKKIYHPSKLGNVYQAIDDIKTLLTDRTQLSKFIRRTDEKIVLYELVWESNINFFFDTGITLTRNMLPKDFYYLDEKGMWDILSDVPDDFFKSDIIMIYTRDSEGNIQQGCTKIGFNKELKINGKVYHDGYYKDGSNIRNVHISTKGGNLLYGRVLISLNVKGEFKSIDILGKNYYQSYLENTEYFDSTNAKDGRFSFNHMYASQSWLAGDSCTTFLKEFRIVINPTKKYTPLVDVDESKVSRSSSRLVDIELKDYSRPDFDTDPEKQQLLANQEYFLDELYNIIYKYDFQEIGQKNRVLPISERMLKMLGSYIVEQGVVREGPGYTDLEYILKKLIGEKQYQKEISSNDPDCLLFKLFSLMRTGQVTHNLFSLTKFRTINSDGSKFTRKDQLNEWLVLFQNYKSPSKDTWTGLDRKMYEHIVEKYSNFKGKTFDTGSRSFSKDERVLAEQIIGVMETIFGKFFLDRTLTGGVYPLGRVAFKTTPWIDLQRAVYEWNMDIGINKPAIYGLLPSENSPIERKRQYLLDRIIVPLKIDLITTNDRDRRVITVDGLPTKVWMPQNFEAPTELDQESVKEYYTSQRIKLWNLAKNRKDITTSYTDEMMSKAQGILSRTLYNSLSRRYSGAKLMSILASTLHTILDDRGRDGIRERNKLHDWIALQGTKEVTLKIKDLSVVNTIVSITLTPIDYDKYFSGDFHTLLDMFDHYKTSIKSLPDFFRNEIEAQIKSQKEYITKIFQYIYTMWQKVYPTTVGGKTHRLIFYVFKATYNDIYSIRFSKNSPYNKLLMPEEWQEWSIPKSNTKKKFGLVFDPTDSTVMDKFIEQLPLFLDLLSRNYVFAVRKDNRDISETDVTNRDVNVLAVLCQRGVIRPDLFKGGSGINSPPLDGVTYYNEGLSKELKDLWMTKVVNPHIDKMLQYHVFRDYSDFLAVLNKITWIKDYRFTNGLGL